MSHKQTQFMVLPNEVIYNIFDFLETSDILRAFAHLNCRYNDLIQFYIKRIDLTDGWEGNLRDFKWICRSIQTLKINQYYVHWLHDLDHKNNSRYYLQRTIPDVKFQFSQLHALHLVNISEWIKVISNMNLKSVSLWFDYDHSDCCEEGCIPQTVTQFSTNIVIETDKFHMDLIDLNVCIRSMIHLLEIVERTPNLQRLSVTFADNFHNTQQTNYIQIIEPFPFDRIQLFIDQCYLKTSILRKVTLKFIYISFNENLWSTIVQYKNTFHRFDFYASFILNDKASIIRIISSNNDHFDYDIEDGDPLHPQARFVHIYSLPFAFDKLHGFISCSQLSFRSSFLSVRHLYLTRTRLACSISFELLTRHMPNLISID
ncbi:unnamed protein product, partial [Adineta steineri]